MSTDKNKSLLQAEADEQPKETNKEQMKSLLIKYATQYHAARFTQDQMAGKYLRNQTLKAIFYVLLQLSYGLFAVGIILTLQSQTIDQQKIVIYLQSQRNKNFLIALIVLGVSIIAVLKTVKGENKIVPKTKKINNFFVDIFRTAFYILALIFIHPFIYDNDSTLLLTSYWLYLIGLGFFIVRKTIKWFYYIFDKEGKKVLGPWESNDIKSKENLAMFSDYINFIIERRIPTDIKLTQGTSPDKIEQLKSVQVKLLQNLQERNQMVSEINELVR